MKKLNKQTPVKAYRIPSKIIKRIARQMRRDKSNNETATVLSALDRGLCK